jgi:hypothetical protein
MTISEIAGSLTGERMMIKCTGGQERPSRDQIARLAYHFYETRGRQDGQQSFAPSQVSASLDHTGCTFGNSEIVHHGKGHRS